jgi:hypothetical protein
MRHTGTVHGTEAPLLSDDELAAEALAADPALALDADAISFWDATGDAREQPLPAWYMPAPMGGTTPLRGWRRRVVYAVIVSFLTITAYGLCNTYGQLALH